MHRCSGDRHATCICIVLMSTFGWLNVKASQGKRRRMMSERLPKLTPRCSSNSTPTWSHHTSCSSLGKSLYLMQILWLPLLISLEKSAHEVVGHQLHQHVHTDEARHIQIIYGVPSGEMCSLHHRLFLACMIYESCISSDIVRSSRQSCDPVSTRRAHCTWTWKSGFNSLHMCI